LWPPIRTSIFIPISNSNPANWQAHYFGTANEIWEQTAGRITHFVAGLGTSGTFVGCTRRFRELNPAIRCISLQPDASFHGLEGWKHMETAIRPSIYDDTLADEDLAVSTEDAYRLVKRIAAKRHCSSVRALPRPLRVALSLQRNSRATSTRS